MMRTFGRMICLVMIAGFLGGPGTVGARPLEGIYGLQSGVPIITGRGFVMALLGSQPVAHEEIREFQGLLKNFQRELRIAEKLGIPLSRPVRILLLMDTKFRIPDLWLCFGLTPDESFFKKMEEDIRKVEAITDNTERDIYQDNLRRNYCLFSGLPASIGDGDLRIRIEPEEVKTFVGELKTSLDKPITGYGRLYGASAQDCYSSHQSTVWIQANATRQFHRYQGTIDHEVGHHLFSLLLDRTISKNGLGKKITIGCMQLLSSFHLTPENELFADYMVIANGNTNIIDVFGWKGERISDEQKRYFSKDRTLVEFLAESKGNASTSHFFNEEHNILNPIRTLLWHLKLKLGLKVVNRMAVAMMEERLKEFFLKDVPSFGHRDQKMMYPGAFSLEKYPSDILTANCRVFRCLDRVGQEILTIEQKPVFNEIAKTVMGKYFSQ
ncbi:MAG: hypothetical protein WA705_10280 [Candidatus Ozemobacteraceae bacterium]